MAKKGKNEEILLEVISTLKAEGIETSTYKELAEKSGLDVNYIRLLYHKNPQLQELFPIDKKHSFGRPKETEEKKLEKLLEKEDEDKYTEANLKDYNNWCEPLTSIQGKIILLRDALYTAATGHKIREEYETYWINGKTPKGIGYEGCTISNIGIRLKKDI